MTQHACSFHPQIRITRATLEQFKTYGELYRALCSTTGEIPVALYRTERQSNDKPFGTAATRFSVCTR